MKHVFVAYAGDDREEASKVGALFAEYGLDAHVACELLPAELDGEPLTRRIHDALDASAHFAVVCTDAARTRPWVHYEIGYARGRRLVPVVYVPDGRSRLLRALTPLRPRAKLVADLLTAGFGSTDDLVLALEAPSLGFEFLSAGLLRLVATEGSPTWRTWTSRALDLPDYFFDLPVRLSLEAMERWGRAVAEGDESVLFEKLAKANPGPSPSERVARRLLAEVPPVPRLGTRTRRRRF